MPRSPIFIPNVSASTLGLAMDGDDGYITYGPIVAIEERVLYVMGSREDGGKWAFDDYIMALQRKYKPKSRTETKNTTWNHKVESDGKTIRKTRLTTEL
ncbi:unnamed protein product [Dovyalis caffra]|uniref:Uncharacterized protein n=1 Tax=Dovyalis caffra TaxID=77055 RepID=A0AAV1QTL9_9ROSI|nr:unnamed protein product [Dovyalis caffra]